MFLLNNNMAEITIEIPIINRKMPVTNVGILIAMGERGNKIIRNKESDFCKKYNTVVIVAFVRVNTVLYFLLLRGVGS
jgi:hypothetical protein